MPSDLTRGGRIADPVHGYVDFTGIERAILDHPAAQRLRHVLQNGLAYLVFPEAVTSRFSHSLGAMHLASQFLAAALRNASSEARDALESGIGEAVKRVLGKFGDVHAAAAAAQSDALVARHYASQPQADSVQLAEAGLRLAALFHDLGHLPLSHDFEYGLEDSWYRLPEAEQQTSPLGPLLEQQPGRTQIHERIGHQLALILLKNVFSELVGTDREAVQTVFLLALRVLESSEAPDPTREEAAMQFLHSLIAGELDVDRCDYILRDARNHSFEFAVYDLARLLDNLVVAQHDNNLVLALRPHGLSAAESFVVARYRSYQYGVRHHKVAQVGAALRYSISKILTSNFDASIPEFKRDLGLIAKGDTLDNSLIADLLRRFSEYDDVWWISLMRRYAKTVNDEWLNLVCWRSHGTRSLWKRVGDFPGDLRTWNARLPDPDDLDAERRWTAAEGTLRDEGVLIMRHTRFTPWKAVPGNPLQSALSVVQGNDSFVPLTTLSPVVASLREAWMSDIQVQAFATSESGMSPAGVIERLVPAST